MDELLLLASLRSDSEVLTDDDRAALRVTLFGAPDSAEVNTSMAAVGGDDATVGVWPLAGPRSSRPAPPRRWVVIAAAATVVAVSGALVVQSGLGDDSPSVKDVTTSESDPRPSGIACSDGSTDKATVAQTSVGQASEDGAASVAPATPATSRAANECWSVVVEKGSLSGAAVTADSVFVLTSEPAELHALSLGTGEEQWVAALGGDGGRLEGIFGEYLIVSSFEVGRAQQVIEAVDPADGRIVWKRDGRLAASAGEHLVLADDTNTFEWIDVRTGQQVRRFNADRTSGGFGEDFFIQHDGQLTVIPATGATVEVPWSGTLYQMSVAFVDGSVYEIRDGASLVRLDPAGQPVWTFALEASPAGLAYGVAAIDGDIVAALGDDKVIGGRVSETGFDPLWSHEGTYFRTIMIDGAPVVVLNDSAYVFVDAETGVELARVGLAGGVLLTMKDAVLVEVFVPGSKAWTTYAAFAVPGGEELWHLDAVRASQQQIATYDDGAIYAVENNGVITVSKWG